MAHDSHKQREYWGIWFNKKSHYVLERFFIMFKSTTLLLSYLTTISHYMVSYEHPVTVHILILPALNSRYKIKVIMPSIFSDNS